VEKGNDPLAALLEKHSLHATDPGRIRNFELDPAAASSLCVLVLEGLAHNASEA
jgi:hypothetical protein